MRPSARAFGAAAVVVALVLWARVWWSAGEALDGARAAAAAGETAAAIEGYAHAMRWYSPGASAPVEAAAALDALAADAEARGDRATALVALRRLRGAILATRGLGCPLCARLDDVNQRLAAVTAAEQIALGQPTIGGRDAATLVADHLALLRLDPVPHPGWAALAVLAFFAWVGGAFLLVWRGFDRALRPVRPAAARYGALVGVGFLLWLLALWQA